MRRRRINLRCVRPTSAFDGRRRRDRVEDREHDASRGWRLRIDGLLIEEKFRAVVVRYFRAAYGRFVSREMTMDDYVSVIVVIMIGLHVKVEGWHDPT